MIQRTLEGVLATRAGRHPAVLVTGPRQSGKTTLCRATFPGLGYVSFEAPDVRLRAQQDPRGLLAAQRGGAIFDEVQRVPELLSYLQGVIDAQPTPGRFILTGSQHFGLREAVSQTLAGRIAVLELLPFGFDELRRAHLVSDLWSTIWTGSYPPIHDRRLPAGEWLASYVATYVERDVRQLVNVTDLVAFQTFLQLCAGRTGQLLNLSQLGAEAGVTHNTARSWLSALEAGYVAFRVVQFARNLGKRLVRTPKLHFLDTGLACWLLGIRSPAELRTHPLRGALFESWVVSEIVKFHRHRGATPRVCFFRDRHGLEADLVVEAGSVTTLVEAMSGATVPSDAFAPLAQIGSLLGGAPRPRVEGRRVIVYGGDERLTHLGTMVLPWNQIDQLDWTA
ncbi:MAG: ATP-binding protein [Deltaproteobacteria bacterium]|nr:ATP-binding protein [Deltaproteobacteria bacterium]